LNPSNLQVAPLLITYHLSPKLLPQLFMREFASVFARVIRDDLVFAVELPFVDEEAAFEFTIYEL